MGPLHQQYLETLRRTQWLEPERLLAYQARLLEDISRHAHENVPFYRDRLGAAVSRRPFRSADVARCPHAVTG